jgi:hypothetical protein
MMKRTYRRLIACIAMLGLWFAQLSLVAFACPLDVGITPPPIAAMATHAGCAGQDQAPIGSALCELHCQAEVSVPSASAPAVALVTSVALVVAVPDEVTRAQQVADRRAPLAAMATAPPAAIRFCRFQI